MARRTGTTQIAILHRLPSSQPATLSPGSSSVINPFTSQQTPPRNVTQPSAPEHQAPAIAQNKDAANTNRTQIVSESLPDASSKRRTTFTDCPLAIRWRTTSLRRNITTRLTAKTLDPPTIVRYTTTGVSLWCSAAYPRGSDAPTNKPTKAPAPSFSLNGRSDAKTLSICSEN